MSWSMLLPLLVVASSLVPGCLIFLLREDRVRTRSVLNLAGAVLKVVLVAAMVWGVSQGETFQLSYPLLPGISFGLNAAPFSLLFVTLSAVLWLFTTIYAMGYLKGSPQRSRFFGFFSLCVSATAGIALAANLLTFLIFYEMLTLTTYPLVVHRGTEQALRGGRIYLAYTVLGGAILLLAIAWLQTTAGTLEFVEGGFAGSLAAPQHAALRWIFALLVVGFGIKAALVPLHSWLPQAMVAPAPVSALLHAVAVVKAGAFGIVRVIYDVFGVEFCIELGVTQPLAIAAAITILYGSLRALFQDNLKRRLAFSTISQVSYIVLGAAVLGPTATIGGTVHLVHQGIMKITLFFAAGNLAETLGVQKVSEMDGVGWRMPGTMASFTIAALGMIGLPPMAGFISKWYLASGALEAGQTWVVGVLLASSALNALYFLPILYAAWFHPPRADWPKSADRGRFETRLTLLLPPMATAAATLLAGLFAQLPFSPLDWARFIVAREYPP
ncbi:complex I subunit 5 family protein [Candidatus Laterigemmans baculatus]|uniref:complex I subunit 5 family protein n=1 Tax=Candidatus Laterigemmans baculatus TaxID=2770505 RepID=UPI0013DBE6F6|nr:proton-conducting transporter membrane subunit [Candidatus Laterigemmans baculatus]